MKNLKLLWILIPVALLLGLGAYLLSRNYVKAQIHGGPSDSGRGAALTAFSYSSAGDMLGSYDGVSVCLEEADGEETVVIRIEEAASHTEEIQTTLYAADHALLEEIRQIFEENGMKRWEKCRESDIIAYDAATQHYCFSFDGVDAVQFSSTQELPTEARDALRAIFDAIERYETEENRLPEAVNTAETSAENVSAGMQTVCPECGETVPAQKYCTTCGAKLPAP